MAIPNPWVWRHDGTIQCEDVKEETLEEARAQLESIIGADNVLQGEKRQVPMPRMCGLPTGSVNAFQITPWGLWLLMHGIVGPMGFRLWLDEGAEGAEGAGGGDGPSSFETLAAGQKATESAARAVAGDSAVPGQPFLIAQLYGRQCRCYNIGDPLTDDYIEGRVNIGLRGDRIVEIWFG